jgi:hypothetical protein
MSSCRRLTVRNWADHGTLRGYSRRGLVASVKIGRHLCFVEADLISYLDGLRQQPRYPVW